MDEEEDSPLGRSSDVYSIPETPTPERGRNGAGRTTPLRPKPSPAPTTQSTRPASSATGTPKQQLRGGGLGGEDSDDEVGAELRGRRPRRRRIVEEGEGGSSDSGTDSRSGGAAPTHHSRKRRRLVRRLSSMPGEEESAPTTAWAGEEDGPSGSAGDVLGLTGLSEDERVERAIGASMAPDSGLVDKVMRAHPTLDCGRVQTVCQICSTYADCIETLADNGLIPPASASSSGVELLDDTPPRPKQRRAPTAAASSSTGTTSGWLSRFDERQPQEGSKRGKGKGKAKLVRRPSSTSGQRGKARSRRRVSLSDEDSDESSDEAEAQQQLGASSATVNFFNTATVEELMTVPRCTKRMATAFVKHRPYSSYLELHEAADDTKGLSVFVVENYEERYAEKRAVERVLAKCAKLSAKLRDIVGQQDSAAWDGHSTTSLTQQPTLLSPKLHLKPYQLIGLNWLILLESKNVNAILADEMGLGKTVQTIAFIAHMKETKTDGPFLVVVPASTLSNWMRELELWCPALRVAVLHGSQEERTTIKVTLARHRSSFDVLLTTYNIAVTKHDRSFLRTRFNFELAVFDEGHMLKNLKSQRYEHLMKLRAKRRLLLTGTPMQNNLVELMSVLSFAMPSLFRGATQYITKMFTAKSSSEDTARLIEKAKTLLAPFVLRRVKDSVLSELPPKSHEVIDCPMTDFQRQAYQRLVDEFKRHVRLRNEAEIKAKADHARRVQELGAATAEAQLHLGVHDVVAQESSISNLLMQLRKMANHPLLHRCRYTDKQLDRMSWAIMSEPEYMDNDARYILEDMQVLSDFELMHLCNKFPTLSRDALPEAVHDESGKCEKLLEILPPMQAKGDRVLMFSQFTTVLDILEVFLRRSGFAFLRLDGSTPVAERQELIDQFNTDTEIFVFLLSTKAGGLGINLTAANVCIIHDIDFNPFSDKQAEDRCHRMGQTRPVRVIRLICKESVERAMFERANEKLKLEKDMTADASGEADQSVLAELKRSLQL